ncbi:MAG: lipoate--protein ligase family protein [Acidimicrobiia bacterium]
MPQGETLAVVRNQLSGDAPMDTAVSSAILQRVTNGDLAETLQVGTPHRVLAFGKHDTLSDGFGDAVSIALQHGYDPTVRIAGGRAVTFSPSIIRFAWTLPVADPATTMHARFEALSSAVVRMLRRFGVEAEIGEIPNEYCAGRYSVHIGGHGKVMGVGQRLSRGAAQVGGLIVIEYPDEINAVLVPVYRALGVQMDPSATGSIADVRSVTASDVSEAFAAEIAGDRPIDEVELDKETKDLASSLRERHVVSNLHGDTKP